MKVDYSQKILKKIYDSLYAFVDKIFLQLDKNRLTRSLNMRLVPNFRDRRGGTFSYIEWGYITGIFHALIYNFLGGKEPKSILDIGCGAGRLAIACKDILSKEDCYIGLDVNKTDINFCNDHYKDNRLKFIHFDVRNASYAPNQEKILKSWPFDDKKFDIVLALSVWTHLCEIDARFYLNEISRVLKPDAVAIITFFVLDRDYDDKLRRLSLEKSMISDHYPQHAAKWIFDQKVYGSESWLCPKWASPPEGAIAVTERALNDMISESGLHILRSYSGSWKDKPGMFFQDIMILQKNNPS